MKFLIEKMHLDNICALRSKFNLEYFILVIINIVNDENHNLIKETDNFGREVINTYDEHWNLIQKKTKINENEYKSEKYTYDEVERNTSITIFGTVKAI